MFCAQPHEELYTPEPMQGCQDVSSGAVILGDFEEPLRLLTGIRNGVPFLFRLGVGPLICISIHLLT